MTTEASQRTGVVTNAFRLYERAKRNPDQVALREKFLGIWSDITFGEYWDAAETVGHALLAMGIEPGDRVAIHSENRPEWLYADLGIQAVRAASMGLYPTNPSAEVRYLLENSGSRILITEDQEQTDKALEVRDQLPDLERIVYIEPRGIRDRYDDPILMSWTDFLAAGREHRQAHPQAVTDVMATADEDDLATLVYTSGTTGPPKGAMLTVKNVNAAIDIAGDNSGFVDPKPDETDLIISYLPLCHAYERAFSEWFGLSAGVVVNFAESIDTIQTDLREIQPSIFQSVPRIYEKMHAGVLIRAASASRLKKLNYTVWMGLADRIGKTLERTGGVHTLVSRAQYAVGYVFLYRALQERLGLRRCRHAISGAAPIAPEILRFFMGIGVPMFEAYGMTENSIVATTNRRGRVKLGTVGEAYPGIDLKIDDETGEILVRHDGVFAGYWRMDEATADTIDEDGWLHTGDVGEWVDGTHVKIVDRMKDIIITAGGKNISPSEIENRLKTSPFVGEAVVIGDRRKYLTALIGIDYDVVSNWAQGKGITHTTYQDLTEKPEVRKLIERVVEETNEKFARVEHLRKFAFFTKELDEDDGELTATQKVKRSAIERRFNQLIEGMY
jgi:long-chain acyl-CoA synthetase